MNMGSDADLACKAGQQFWIEETGHEPTTALPRQISSS
jgi:hypothetical protein